jgi:glycosyltransferase involved in cell wall biosynthesis
VAERSSPRVTVCIPTYARTDWLPEAIESVLGQSFGDFVLLIGDDATPGDAVRPVVEAYDDPRIRFVRFEDNLGIVGNFNRTLRLSETEYVLQIGDDDVLEPELLEATVEALDRHPRAGLVHSRFDLIDARGELLARDTAWTDELTGDTVEAGADFLRASMLLSWGRVNTSTALLRRSAVPSAGFRVEDAPPFDFACWLEIARTWDIAFLGRSLCRYRLHDRSFTSGGADVTSSGYLHGLDSVREIHRVKLAFLERSYPPGAERRLLERLAVRSLRHEHLFRVRQQTLPERRIAPTVRGLARIARAEPGVLREPATWAMLAGSLVGQRGVTALRRFIPERPPY